MMMIMIIIIIILIIFINCNLVVTRWQRLFYMYYWCSWISVTEVEIFITCSVISSNLATKLHSKIKGIYFNTDSLHCFSVSDTFWTLSRSS